LKGTGGMLAVGLGPSQAATYLTSSSTGQQTLSIACYNSPSSVTISGNVTEIETMKKELDRKEISADGTYF
jgi:acyl transferase domain-containing protein